MGNFLHQTGRSAPPVEVAAHDDQRDIGDSGWAELRRLYSEQFTGSILDAGGGSGVYAEALAAAGLDVVIADVDDGMLDAARRRGLDPARILRADVTALPFLDGSFDGVHVAHILHVVSDWKRAVYEIVRVTRPGGAVLLALGGGGTQAAEQWEIAEHINHELGAGTVTAGQAAGLDGPEAADGAFTGAGMTFVGVRCVDGVQTRTVEQLIDRMTLNPFRSAAGRDDRAGAAGRVKDWARKRFGSLDQSVDVPAGIEYRIYRKRTARLPVGVSETPVERQRPRGY